MSEKIADIVAQMRGRGEDGRMDMSLWRQYADRIEEAAKREKAETEAEALAVVGVVEAARHTPGNAAALREAIKPWVAFGEWLLQNAGKKGLNDAIRENGPIIRQRLEEIRAAIAKPPRQCDVEYADRVEMYGAFKDWCKAKGHTMEPMLAYDAFDWLLAPAERKGECDA